MMCYKLLTCCVFVIDISVINDYIYIYIYTHINLILQITSCCKVFGNFFCFLRYINVKIVFNFFLSRDLFINIMTFLNKRKSEKELILNI
jgi:hypothetical protein